MRVKKEVRGESRERVEKECELRSASREGVRVEMGCV